MNEKFEIEILLFQDHQKIVNKFNKVLKKYYKDFNLKLAENIEEFQNYLIGDPPDIIIAAPHKDVNQVWTALDITRFYNDSIPFILFSSENDEKYLLEGIERGAAEYISSSDFDKLTLIFKTAILRKKQRDSFPSNLENVFKNKSAFETGGKNSELLLPHKKINSDKNSYNFQHQEFSADSYNSVIQFRSVIESVSEVIFQTDYEGKLIYLNPFWSQLTGYSQAESYGENFLKYFHLDDVHNILNSFISLIYRKSDIIKTEKRIVTKDQQIRWIEINARLSFDKKDQLAGMSGTIRDIHESKLAKEELIFAKIKAEESDRLKTFFLAQMSHEIRTPLNVMLSYSSFIEEELKLKGVSNDLIDEGFQSISESGKRLVRTMDLILNMSLISTGQVNINPEKTNVVNIITAITDDFKTYAAKKNLEINFINNCSEGFVFADEYTLTNAFYNIIDNSLKYTDKGGINIIASNGGPNLMVEIKDTGIGISEEYLNSMFEPFTQEDSGYTRKFDGSGLGLALTKKYIELNKGEIFVDSKKGMGTTFKIMLKCMDNGNI